MPTEEADPSREHGTRGEGAGTGVPIVRIFVSSPSDVAEERKLALGVIGRLQGLFRGRLVLVPILWEQEPLLATAGFQQEINRRAPPSATDVALFVLWSRMGTPLGPEFVLEDGRRPSGTEWEFEDASRGHREHGAPHLLVYRKQVPPRVEVTDPSYDQRRADFQAVHQFFESQFRTATDLTFTGSFHAFADAAEFGQLLESHLTKILTERLAGDAQVVTWVGSPFRGLETFEAEHAPIFFGRSRAIQDVRQALARQVAAGRAFVLVLGRSGNGKSSLARAGVLPLLDGPWLVEEGVEGGFCRKAVMQPGAASSPLEALAEALLAEDALPELSDKGGPAELAALFADSPQNCVGDVRAALRRLEAPPPGRLLLLVDQLEELFTHEGITEGEREAFARVLDALARSGTAYVLATLRSDFYAAFSKLELLMALKAGHGQYDLPPVDPAETAQIIRGPAQMAGLTYEVDTERGRALEELLVADAMEGPDALPLLEYALTLLEERKQDRLLTLAAYEEMGGLEGAVARRAEEEWRALPDAARKAFPTVLRALVEVSEGRASVTRRGAPLEEMDHTPGARLFLERFVSARLLVAHGAGGQVVVTVAHEALLRTWPRMADRIDAEAELLRIRSRVRAAAARWAQQRRDSSLLLASGKPLEEARLLRAARYDLTRDETALLEASETREHRQRILQRASVAAIAVLGACAAVLAVWANGNRVRANERARVAQEVQANALDLAVETQKASGELAALVARRGQFDDYQRAQELLEDTLRASALVFGPNDPRYAQGLRNLAEIRSALGDYTGAAVLLEQALQVAATGHGAEHPVVASILIELSSQLQFRGDYEGALERLDRALGIIERSDAPPQALHARCLAARADLFETIGDYESSRSLHERSLALLEQEKGRDHPDVARGMCRLAELYVGMGQARAARTLVERALEVLQAALGPTHPDVARAQILLARLLSAEGDRKAAEAMLQRALPTLEDRLGSEHPSVGRGFHQLGQALLAEDDAERARQALEKAAGILEGQLGGDHPDVARCLCDLALAWTASSEPEKAQPLLNRALEIYRNCFDVAHLDTVRALSDLAMILLEGASVDEAIGTMSQALDLLHEIIGESVVAVYGPERLEFIRSVRLHLDRWLRITASTDRTGYPEVLRFKGLITRIMSEERRLLRQSDARAAADVRALVDAERVVAELANGLPPVFKKEAVRSWRKDYAEARAVRETRALVVARRLGRVAAGGQIGSTTPTEVQASLAEDEVLVDYLRAGDRYVAWIVPPTGEVRRFDLGPADAVEEAVRGYVEVITDHEASDAEASEEAGRRLRDMVFGAVESSFVAPTRTIVVCPDAALTAISFAALPGADPATYLADTYRFAYVGMAQDILSSVPRGDGGGAVLLVGDPTFSSSAEDDAAAIWRGPAERGRAFNRLPGTRAEVKAICRQVGDDTIVLLGRDACEARVRELCPGKRIVHFATHGWAREDLTRGLRRRRGHDDWLGHALERQLAVGHDPMTLAGIALAGANALDDGEGGDGLLTALEASRMDFSTVELAVLSACRTATGQVRSGEGVVGLVRGLRLAGARRIIASLWRVDDEATQMLMSYLYEGMFRAEDPLPPVDALAEAARKVRAHTGADGRSLAAPRFWASFVCHGR